MRLLISKPLNQEDRFETNCKPNTKKTDLENVERRIELLKTATTSTLKENKDPMLQLALRLRTHLRRMEDRNRALTGEGI